LIFSGAWAQVLVGADQATSGDGAAAGSGGDTQSLDWVYGEHSSGAAGWFPRCCGTFFGFGSAGDSAGASTSAGALAAAVARPPLLRLEPLDGHGGVFALGGAISRGDLPAPSCRALLVAALRSLWCSEGLYVQGLGVLVGGFVQPLEVRDSPAKQTLLGDPYVAMATHQLRDLFFYHTQFFKACGQAADGLQSDGGNGGLASAEQQRLLTVAAGLSALVFRFTLYRDYVSNLPAATDALFASGGKLSKPLAKFLEQHPLPPPLLSSADGRASAGVSAAAATASSNSSNLAARFEWPARQYREYQPIFELLLRCAAAPGGCAHAARSGDSSSIGADVQQVLSACLVEVSSATAAVNVARAVGRSVARLLALQSLFVGRVQVIAKGRQLLHGGKLFKIHAADKTSASKEQRVVHLFNDVLIYSIPKAGGRLQFRK
jgi:hypothetical protein